jgi:hypothetical protein
LGTTTSTTTKCIGIYGVSGRNASSASIQEKCCGSFPSFADCGVDDTTLAQKADNDVEGPQRDRTNVGTSKFLSGDARIMMISVGSSYPRGIYKTFGCFKIDFIT